MESGDSENAFSTSISQGNGSSRAEATVVDGLAVATGIHEIKFDEISSTNDNLSFSSTQDSNITEINFDDPFFRPEFIDPFQKNENDSKKTISQIVEVETSTFQTEDIIDGAKLDGLDKSMYYICIEFS